MKAFASIGVGPAWAVGLFLVVDSEFVQQVVGVTTVAAFTPAATSTRAYSSTRQQQTQPNTFRSRTARTYAERNDSPFSTTATTAADEIRGDAQDALTNVGWSLPADGNLSADDPFVQAIDAGILKDFGVSLDELLNPAKVVNLERDLYVLRTQLAALTGKAIDPSLSAADPLVTTECDGGGGGEEAATIRVTIQKKEADLAIERRSVFRGWLKNVFLGQAILSFALSNVMATNPAVLFGGFDWYNVYNMDISIAVLGYWWWWLFVIPSLRSRRPQGMEKKALDLAFLACPAVSLVAPVFTKETGLIWGANLAVVAASYGFAYLFSTDGGDNDDDDGGNSQAQPDWLKFVFKSLDFGSGRERGARN